MCSFAMGFDGGGYLRLANVTRLSCMICTVKHHCGAMMKELAGPGGAAAGGGFVTAMLRASLLAHLSAPQLCLALCSSQNRAPDSG